jgi:mannose-6-phosphate isomerase-like protein (cupin superfamily)
MTPFTHINLLELEDTVAGRAEGIEGRFGRKHLESRDLGISHWRYAPGFQAETAHRHGEQEEAYVVVSGSGRLKLDDEIVEVRQWDVIRVAPQVARAFEGGPEGLEIVAVGSDRPEGGDGVRVEDFWGD